MNHKLAITAAIALLAGGCALLHPRTSAARRDVDDARANLAALDGAIQRYIADHGEKPPPRGTLSAGMPVELGNWWGFGPLGLDEPIANSPFVATDLEQLWQQLGNEAGSAHPPIYVPGVRFAAMMPPGAVLVRDNMPAQVARAPVPEDWARLLRDADYILVDAGPDGVLGTVWGGPVVYDPTNGALSYGDILHVRRTEPEKGKARSDHPRR